MPRENSFSDSEGASLTSDGEEEHDAPSPISPTYTSNPFRIPSPLQPTVPHASPQSPGRESSSKRSIRSQPKASTSPVATRPLLDPRQRFRSTVRKIMAMHRSTSMMVSAGGAGAEPGVDPRRASADLQFGGIKKDCIIEVLDYSSLSHMYGRMTNKEFVNMMDDPKASARESWAKVRWINIGGLSWDVMKAITLKYDIHPLALEDVFHTRSQTRSKADYYPKHLFLRVLCHELGDEDDDFEAESMVSAAYGSTLTDIPRSSSPEPFTEEEYEMLERGGQFEDDKTVFGSKNSSRKSTMRMRGRATAKIDIEKAPGKKPSVKNLFNAAQLSQHRRKRQQMTEEARIHALKKGDRVNVKVSPMFIFLFRDGTVISIHTNPDMEFTRPINMRLQQRDTGLRTSSDPSLLVQSLLDLIVDRALEVVDEYQAKIKKFERQVLLKPEMSTVRNLHILSGDLILHKRTMEPIRTLIYGLRRYDTDRCAALIDPAEVAKRQAKGEDVKVVGFMSHKSKIYLADVFDHMEYILSSLEMFTSISENLVNFTFNMTSYEMNVGMRALTLITVICLPLTLLTGYFGMNFDPMWSVQQNSDLLFWKIALPVLAVVLPLFLLSDIKKLLRYIKKKMLTKKAVKNYKIS